MRCFFRLPLPDVASLITLTDYMDSGAVCLDGTPYEIWYAAASNPTNASKWVFDIQGKKESVEKGVPFHHCNQPLQEVLG